MATSPLIRETKPEDLLCTVIAVRDRQAAIQNNLRGIQDWDREYVEFSGYFGTHGPHVFAAAPELFEALKKARGSLNAFYVGLGMTDKGRAQNLAHIDAALAKAAAQ